VPQIDVIDSTWIPSRPAAVAAEVADPHRWAQWWPGLRLQVQEDRGDKGVRWLVPAGSSGAAAGLAGSAEVWLQPMFDGVVAHFFLRLDAVPGVGLSRRRAARVERFYRRRTKQAFWELADRADPERLRRAAPQPPPAGRAGQSAPAARPAPLGRPAATREPGSL
jgi:hypothetical protein